MRRTLCVASFIAAAAFVAVFLLKPSASPARSEKDEPATIPAVRSPLPQLPIARAVLFSSGVGYFQREGEVEGNARIDLSFPVQDINDLLKSLVLQDAGGGHVTAVSYDSHDPVAKTLQSFAVNLAQNPSFSQILTQARGEKVEVALVQPNALQPGPLQGTIVGVERQKQQAGKEVVEVEVLNLWCADGLHAVKLADVQRLQFANPVMESEFKRALNVLAMSHDAQKKAVSLSFTGDGKRQVKVGYVVQNPIWKTSYRLVLGEKEKPLLQGWAVVENPSDEDWTNVRLALVSGRPISFQMDLYQPLYVPRPLVEPELFASLRPQAYSGGMGMMGGGGGFAGGVAGQPMNAPATAAPAPTGGAAAYLKKADGKAGARQEAEQLQLLRETDRAGLGDLGVDFARTVATAATATDLGNFFQYAIANPVNLPRQKSALLPIVNKDIEGSKVSIYNQATLAKFPLLGLRLKNTSGLHLMQGPITVFEGSSYAGDARIQDLQPNEDRLLSYAIDLGVEVEPVVNRAPERLTTIKINKGILYATNKIRESKTYNAKNRSEHDRTLVIEHPYRPEFKLVSKEKPAERARDVYRFEVKVPAGKSATEEVAEEQDLVRQVVLTNSDDNTMRFFMNSTAGGEDVKSGLKQALELKGRWDAVRRELADLEAQLKSISDDQTRLRENLRTLPQTTDIYKRYLKKLDEQETEIDGLQGKIKKLRDSERQERTAYEAFLASLTVG